MLGFSTTPKLPELGSLDEHLAEAFTPAEYLEAKFDCTLAILGVLQEKRLMVPWSAPKFRNEVAAVETLVMFSGVNANEAGNQLMNQLAGLALRVEPFDPEDGNRRERERRQKVLNGGLVAARVRAGAMGGSMY